jgi:serine/threonine protein kinase
MPDDSRSTVHSSWDSVPASQALRAAGVSVGMSAAPSLPLTLASPAPPTDLLSLSPGAQIEDYQVVALLGRGGFGAVYLAWQISLGRQVALKVSPCIGLEGRTLARLDHPHIVRVYSETVCQETRLLCMQYVASIALDELLKRLAAKSPSWTGQDLLAQIDAQHTVVAGEFDPAQLADRHFLSQLDHVDAVCWIGSRLADALAHAHRHGVLHRDLKPGNVLVSQYGRPMLVDFNLANLTREAGTASQLFGGTLPYMSPEHLEAFDPEQPADAASVTEASDIYSLGIVLFELLTGRLPFPTPPSVGTMSQRLSTMIAHRQQPVMIWLALEWQPWQSEQAVRRVLERALQCDPSQRWKNADEFSQALSEVLELRSTLKKVDRIWPLSRFCAAWPFISLAILGLAPHFLGSLVNIPYNLLQVVRTDYGADRVPVFFQLVNVYNVLVYPVCIGLCIWLTAPVFGWWRRKDRAEASDAQLAGLRRRVMAFPRLAIAVALLGWLPGAIWFPWGLNRWAGPLTWAEVLHLQVSVALSGLIALTYSALGVACISVCVFYPKLWIDPSGFRELAHDEVKPLRSLLRAIPFLAGTIPLMGASLLVTTSPQSFSDSEYLTFRLLTTGLIALGMIGFQAAVLVTSYARRAVEAFGGAE